MNELLYILLDVPGSFPASGRINLNGNLFLTEPPQCRSNACFKIFSSIPLHALFYHLGHRRIASEKGRSCCCNKHQMICSRMSRNSHDGVLFISRTATSSISSNSLPFAIAIDVRGATIVLSFNFSSRSVIQSRKFRDFSVYFNMSRATAAT
jgi:hypothetical protein